MATSPMLKAADFDFQKEAGPMQGATNWTPSNNAMASEQLSKLLASDSKLMTQARSKAMSYMARRGLSDSSIGAEAGESAAIGQAVPIATQDAGTWARSEEFNANAANQFAMDANRFGRDVSLTKYRGLLDRETQERDQTFRAGESVLDRELTRSENAANRTFQTGEREASQRFQSGENQADRQFRTGEREAGERFQAGENQANRNFQAGENQADRQFRTSERIAGQEFQTGERRAGQDFQAGENRATRDFQASQDALNRAQQEAMTRLTASLNEQAAARNIPQQQVAAFTERMQVAIGNILADPNLTPEAKQVAIQNYQAYANQTMSWMASFYKTETPNVTGGPNFGAPAPGPAPGPAPAPAPTPAPAPAPAPSEAPPSVFFGGGRGDREEMEYDARTGQWIPRR